MKWLEEHWFRLGILIVLVFAFAFALYIAYEALVAIPQATAIAQVAEQQQQAAAAALAKQTAASDLSNCMLAASEDESANWASACKSFGISNSGPNCTLPTSNANTVTAAYQSEKSDCFQEYPQN